jgi:hypothetical protein
MSQAFSAGVQRSWVQISGEMHISFQNSEHWTTEHFSEAG